MRLLSYNIRFGGTGREKLIAGVIRSQNPDLVILQEATKPDAVEAIAKQCEMKTWGAMSGHSLAFMSQVALSHHAWHRVPFAKRRYLELAVATSGLRVFGVHLAAIHSNPTERRRHWELSALLRDIDRHKRGPHLVTGDFNTLAPGEQLQPERLPLRLRALLWMTGRTIRWTTIKLMLDGGYVDMFRSLHPSDDGYTLPTWDPHVRLDYTFVPRDLARSVSKCEVIRDAPSVREASDHFPLLTELDVPEKTG